MLINHLSTALIAIAIGYLLGSIPNGYLAGKWITQIDLREIGSGSTGATNVLRNVGKGPALCVFLLDVGKGTLPVLIAKSLLLEDNWQVATGLAAIIGHIWPIWLNWKGGKAVATGLGIFLGISWSVGLACLGIFLIVLSVSKIVSLSSITAAISLPLMMLISFSNSNLRPAYLIISIIAMFIVLWRHRSNWKRVLNGTEPKIGHSR